MTSQCDVITGKRRNVLTQRRGPAFTLPETTRPQTRHDRKIKLYPACHTLPHVIGNTLVSRAYNRFITFNNYSDSSLTITRIAVSMIALNLSRIS